MDILRVFQFLTDSNGDYVYDSSGNIIISSTEEYPLDRDTSGIISRRQDVRSIHSFTVLANDNLDDWTLIINKNKLIGRYPTQATALGALVGCFVHAGADEEGYEFSISEMIQDGRAQIDEDGNNLISQRVSGGVFTGIIRNFDLTTWVEDGYGQRRISNGGLNELWLQSTDFGQSSYTSNKNSLTGDPYQSFDIKAEYDKEYRVRVRVSDVTIPSPEFNDMFLSDIAFAPISVNVSFPAGTPIVGQPLTATATLTNFDSRIPVKYQWTWTENPAGSATVVKTETTSHATSSFTPTSQSVYRATCELLYAFDDSAVGESSFENSTDAFEPFSWVQGPEILNPAQDQYYVFPTTPADYEGNSPVTFDYEWLKNGSPFGTNNASQVLTDPGNYTVDVTGSNSVNSQTFSETILTRNSITINPPGADVQFIRLFTALGPSGTDVTNNPPANTQLYAYAYSDAAGTQLITDDVTYTGPTVIEDYDAAWMDPTVEALPTARWINADGEEASGTYYVGIVAEHIVGISDIKIYVAKHVGSDNALTAPGDWTLVDTVTSKSNRTYRGNDLEAYWAGWTVPTPSDSTVAECWKFKAEVTSKPYPGYASGSMRELGYTVDTWGQPTTVGSGAYSDIGLLRYRGWGTGGNTYGLNSPNKRMSGPGTPFDGAYYHSVSVGRPYQGDLFINFATGDDTSGDGSIGNPYQTLNVAMRDNESPTASYDYVLMNGDHYIKDLPENNDYSVGQTMNRVNASGGGRVYVSGGHAPVIKAAVSGNARIVGICDSNGNPMLSSSGTRVPIDCEWRGIVFYGDDIVNGVWDQSGNASMWYTASQGSRILDGCTQQNRWDYSGETGNNSITHWPSQAAEFPSVQRGSFTYNCFTINTSNGVSGTVGINHVSDGLVNDAVFSQCAINQTFSKLDNTYLDGNNADDHQDTDWAWTESSGTISGSFSNWRDYNGNPVTATDQRWYSLSIESNGRVELTVEAGTASDVPINFGTTGIVANGKTYYLDTAGTTISGNDKIVWETTHFQNAKILNLYADLLAEGPGNAASPNQLRGGSPHCDVAQFYCKTGDKTVDNIYVSGIDASAPTNQAQGLFIADQDLMKNCYFGDMIMNTNGNGTGKNFAGRDKANVCMKFGSPVNSSLFERIKAVGGSWAGATPNSAKNVVLRNCDWVTYSTTPTDGNRDDSSTRGLYALAVSTSGANQRSLSTGKDYWYGGAEFPLEAGFPGNGFMFTNSDGVMGNGLSSSAWIDAEAPALDPGWISPLNGTRYEVTGNVGIPQKGPMDSHWLPDITPGDWYVDPVFDVDTLEVGDSVLLDTVPVAYASAVPATTTWEWTLDNVGTGQTAALYVIQAGDVGKFLRCVITASDGTTTDLVTSHDFGVVQAAGTGWAEKDNGAWLVNSINYSNSSIDELLPSSYLPSGALGIRYNGGSEQCTGNGYGYTCKIDGGLNRPVGTCSVVIWRPSTSSWVGAYEGCCAGNRFYRSAVSGGTGPSAGDIVILQTDVVDWADVQNWDPYDGPVTPPASSKIVFTGDIAGSNNQGWTTSAADYQLAGTDDVDDNYMRLGSGGAEIRNNGTSMRFNFQIQPTSPDYASATAWKDAVNASTINLSDCFVKLDGVDYPVTGITVNQYSPSIFFQMSSSDVTAFFAAIQAGSTYEFAIDWQ